MRVIVVSTHRSDKAHYAPLLRCLRATPGLEVTLYAVNDFYKTPDYIDAVRPLHKTRSSLPDEHYDAGIVLGDRYEMLLAAMQLVDARISLLHIHGGEHTYGSLDERWRWAMSAIADVHCVATDQAKEAVDDFLCATRDCDEPSTPARRFSRSHAWVQTTGAPGLDDIHDRQPFPNAPKIVVLYNPAIDEETTRKEWGAILDVWRAEGWVQGEDVMHVKSNGDRFSECIGGGCEYDSEKFRDLLAAAHVIVGNSSAGIIEAPSLGTWTVNVGERQAGRPRAGNVFDVPGDASAIRDAIDRAFNVPVADSWGQDKWGQRYIGANPYGDGHASDRIRDVLLGMMAS